MKLRLFRTNIYSMLLYASSTWKATVPVFRKRQAFINSYLCYVSSVNSSLIHWYTNEEIRRWTGQTHVDENADRFHIEKRWQLHCYVMSCSGTHYVRIADKCFILELHCAENGGRLHASRKVWRTWPRTHGGNNPFFCWYALSAHFLQVPQIRAHYFLNIDNYWHLNDRKVASCRWNNFEYSPCMHPLVWLSIEEN